MTTTLGDLLELLDSIATNPHPLATPERERIVGAIRADALAHFGEVNPNRVRARLTNAVTGALDVNPRVLSSTYSSLRQRGALERVGWVESDDTHGKNGGKRLGRYRWVAA